jgi:hypothetical protein
LEGLLPQSGQGLSERQGSGAEFQVSLPPTGNNDALGPAKVPEKFILAVIAGMEKLVE